jgi:hypothetical protein
MDPGFQQMPKAATFTQQTALSLQHVYINPPVTLAVFALVYCAFRWKPSFLSVDSSPPPISVSSLSLSLPLSLCIDVYICFVLDAVDVCFFAWFWFCYVKTLGALLSVLVAWRYRGKDSPIKGKGKKEDSVLGFSSCLVLLI